MLTLRKSKKDVIWKWVCYIYVPAYYPPSTSSWTSQCFWPLFLCHISLPVALPRFSPFYPLLLYHSLTFSNASNISAPPLFFVLFNRSSLSPNNFFFFFFTFFPWHNFLFVFALYFFSPVCSYINFFSHMFYSLLFIIPHSPPFAILSHRPFSGQCGHHRRGASAPAGSGAVSPWGVCKCLLPWFAGAAEPRRELHTHPGLSALWHG